MNYSGTALVVDESGDRKYYSQIPHLIDDLGLSVYAYRLYGHLKRVTGETGQSWQSTKKLATYCNMSVFSVVEAKKELVKNRLIKITTEKSKRGGRDYHLITIIDIWKRNVNCYAKEQVSEANLQVSQDNEQVSVAQRKNNPLKNATQKPDEENEAADAEPITVENSSEFSPFATKQVADSTLLDANIQIIKRVSGYYPKKVIRPTLIKIFAKRGNLDEEEFKNKYIDWVGAGYNPVKWKGILDHYYEHGYYMADQDKLSQMTETTPGYY